MIRLFIIPFLFILMLTPISDAAVKRESIKVEFNVSGPGCKHIFIKNLKGEILMVTTEDELFSDEKESDRSIIRQLKRELNAQSMDGLTSKTTLKTELEKVTFSVGDKGK